MRSIIVKCKPTKEGNKNCPMIKACLARLNDETITGCGLPLACAGLIKLTDVMVEHTVKKDDAD